MPVKELANTGHIMINPNAWDFLFSQEKDVRPDPERMPVERRYFMLTDGNPDQALLLIFSEIYDEDGDSVGAFTCCFLVGHGWCCPDAEAS